MRIQQHQLSTPHHRVVNDMYVAPAGQTISRQHTCRFDPLANNALYRGPNRTDVTGTGRQKHRAATAI
jgi:hypothetical protein